MNKLFLTIPFLLFVSAIPVYAQDDATSSIAMIFDSPVFFWLVVGSGILFFTGSVIFMYHTRKLETGAVQWSEGKSPEELISLLDSPVEEEARKAQMALVNQLKENEYPVLVKSLEKQRDSGKISVGLIHLMEDMAIQTALPVLESIARGKTKMAAIAADAITRIPAEDATEK